LVYPDGFAIWAWHGLRVAQAVIEKPESITIAQIDAEKNAEVRRVLTERFGAARYLLESGATPKQKDVHGILYQKPLPDDETLVMVRVLNSTPEDDGHLSRDEAIELFGPDAPAAHDGMMLTLAQVPVSLRFKDYFLRVPPAMRSARQAVAWTFGKEAKDYAPLVQT
jgi:hypothetical protein